MVNREDILNAVYIKNYYFIDMWIVATCCKKSMFHGFFSELVLPQWQKK